MVVVCLDAFGEMPTQMIGRPIFLKQTGYKLFRPGALSLANTLADLPFSALRVLLFDIIVYFMVGLRRNAGGFFTFHVLIYIAFLTMQGGHSAFCKRKSRLLTSHLCACRRLLPNHRYHLPQLRLGLPNCQSSRPQHDLVLRIPHPSQLDAALHLLAVLRQPARLFVQWFVGERVRQARCTFESLRVVASGR